jgi:hypothetical protein
MRFPGEQSEHSNASETNSTTAETEATRDFYSSIAKSVWEATKFAVVISSTLAPAPLTKDEGSDTPNKEAEKLVKQLGEDDFFTREEAHAQLKKLGPRALREMGQALKNSNDAEVLSRCEKIVGGLLREHKINPEGLSLLLKDRQKAADNIQKHLPTDLDARKRLADTLRKLGDPADAEKKGIEEYLLGRKPPNQEGSSHKVLSRIGTFYAIRRILENHDKYFAKPEP